MCEARGTRIVWSEANAHLYRAKQAGWTDGSVALAEAEVDGKPIISRLRIGIGNLEHQLVQTEFFHRKNEYENSCSEKRF